MRRRRGPGPPTRRSGPLRSGHRWPLRRCSQPSRRPRPVRAGEGKLDCRARSLSAPRKPATRAVLAAVVWYMSPSYLLYTRLYTAALRAQSIGVGKSRSCFSPPLAVLASVVLAPRPPPSLSLVRYIPNRRIRYIGRECRARCHTHQPHVCILKVLGYIQRKIHHVTHHSPAPGG